MRLEDEVRELPKGIPDSERRDVLEDFRDHSDTVLLVPADQTSGRRGGCLSARYLLRSYLTYQDTPSG